MGKIMKSGKVVLVLAGRFAGRKAIIVKNYDDSTQETLRTCPRCWCRPLPQKGHQQNEQEEGCQAIQDQAFVKIVNYNHMMPTRYSVDLNLDKALINKESIKDPLKRKKARFAVRTKFEERYKTGKNRWFFSKLRF